MMDIQHYFIEQGQGEALILLHGNGEDCSYFEGQTGEFARYFHVFAVDTRGHGKTPRGERPFTIRQFADDLLAFMDEQGIEKAHLLGFSDGGNIAMIFALRYPERVNRLILNGANLNAKGVKPSIQIPIEIGYRTAKLFARKTDEAKRHAEMLNRYLKPESYTLIYKLQGVDTDRKTIEKPAITPIFTNRDTVSAFLAEVQNTTVAPIEPVYVDFAKELTKGKVDGMDALYKQNDVNDIFNVQYVWEFGDFADPLLVTAAGYADYLGTSDMTAAQLKQALYNIACSMSFRVADRRTTLSISGLQEYMPQALKLVEHFVADMQPDDDVLAAFKADMIRGRMVNKTDQRANFTALRQYVLYGPGSPATRTLSNDEVMALDGRQLTDHLRALAGMQHHVVYYGPATSDEAFRLIAENHHAGTAAVPANQPAPYQKTDENVVFVAPFVANNTYLYGITNLGTPFDLAKHPSVQLFNEYFGNGMNGIVFQEMREARGLAYSASADDVEPRQKDETELFGRFIITQNDKVIDALTHFDEITDNMPVSEAAFNIAKEGLLAQLRTQRFTGQRVLRYWESLQDVGLNTDIRRDLFNKVQDMTLADVTRYQQQNLKSRSYYTCVLGDESQLDMDALARWGRIVRLTTEEIFGY